MAALGAGLDIEKFIEDVHERPQIWERNYQCHKSFIQETWEHLATIHELPIQTLKAKWKGLRDNFRVEFKRIPRDDNGAFMIRPEEHVSKWLHYKSLLFLTDHMRSRSAKFDDYDTFYGDMSHQSGADYNSSSYITDELIHIPDDDDDDDCEENDEYSFNGVQVNMGRLEYPSISAAATLVKPIIKDEVDSSKKQPPLKKIKLANGGIKFKNEDASTSQSPYQQSLSMSPLPQAMLGNNGEPAKAADTDYHFLMSLLPYMSDLSPSQKLKVRMKIQKLIFKELYKDDVDE